MKKILNIGCGNDTEGTDFLDLYPQRKEVKKYNADTDIIPYKSNTFDKVMTNNMFEHLRNHKLFLDECCRVLKRGGTIYLRTDNAFYFGWFFNKQHSGLYNEYGEKDLHYALFTEEHLKNHLKDAGFKNCSVHFLWNKNSKPLTRLIRFFLPYEMKHPYIVVEAKK